MAGETTGTQYATLADFYLYGLQQAAVPTYSNVQLNALLATVSSEIDSYLGSRFVLPLTQWPLAITVHCCGMAAYVILAGRGYNPQDPANIQIRKRYDDAIRWLRDVASNLAVPQGVVDSSVSGDESGTPGAFVQQARVVHNPLQDATSGLSLSGPPPTALDQSDEGVLVVGLPKLRGW